MFVRSSYALHATTDGEIESNEVESLGLWQRREEKRRRGGGGRSCGGRGRIC